VAPPATSPPLLEVEDLRVEFRTGYGTVAAVSGLSYTLAPGETLAILGESGSGKSVGASAVMGILERPPAFVTGGAVRLRGEDLLTAPARRQRELRGESISMVFQDALSALNPVLTVGDQIGEMFRAHRGAGRAQARAAAVELLDRVRIPSARFRVRDYPHQLSGGMRQRVMIAMALALDPAVLLADEPTTALDVTVQAQILALLAELRDETGMGLVLITHDLGVVAEAADRVAVMYAGRIVETGTAREVFRAPAHPYTAGLMTSLPRVDARGERLRPIAGAPPDLAALPVGCAFSPRCGHRRVPEPCDTLDPPLREVRPGRRSACHFAEEVLR
jgi:oligopeptide transport system ATP-binding protein